MRALPWSTFSGLEPEIEVTVMASKLPLRAYRHIPAFLWWTLRIRRQLAGAPGLVGYALDAHLLRRTFWTVSAWTGPDAIEEFVRLDPHHTGMVASRPHMRPSAFVFWTVRAGDLPVGWDECRRRLLERESHQDTPKDNVEGARS